MSELLTGRDLDAAIVKTIFGWTEHPIGKDANGENDGTVLRPDDKDEWFKLLPPIGCVHKAYFAPMYHSCLYEALKLARHVKLTTPAWNLPHTPEAISQLCYTYWLFDRVAIDPPSPSPVTDFEFITKNSQ